MDAIDRQHYVAAYRALAEILARPRPADAAENHLSYALGDLTRRVFVGTDFLPPDELLEQCVSAIRCGQPDEQQVLAQRLREHAAHLENLPE